MLFSHPVGGNNVAACWADHMDRLRHGLGGDNASPKIFIDIWANNLSPCSNRDEVRCAASVRARNRHQKIRRGH